MEATVPGLPRLQQLPYSSPEPTTASVHQRAASATAAAAEEAHPAPEAAAGSSRFRSLPVFVSSSVKSGRCATPQGGSRPGTPPLRPTTATSTASLAAGLQSIRPATSGPTPSHTGSGAAAAAAAAAASRAHAWVTSATSVPAPNPQQARDRSFSAAGASKANLPRDQQHALSQQQQQQQQQQQLGARAQGPPLFTPGGSRPATAGQTATFKDLLSATRKTYAAGMGEWDLQPQGWSHPEFQSALLQGPLGPEVLHSRHGMAERDIALLYRVLYTYSTGFCAAVFEPVHAARHREQLLETIFAAYAGLWDQALGICFRSEVVDAMKDRSGAMGTAEQLALELGQSRAESAELHSRLNGFVRSSIDSMLAQRLLHDQALTAEAEALVLNKSSEVMSVRLAGSEVKVQALSSQVEAAEAKAAQAAALAGEREAVCARLRAAMAEQQGQLARQCARAAELERALAAAQALAEAETAAKLAAQSEAARTPIHEEEWERRLADKSLAYVLLRTDYVVKMHDLDELRDVNAKLQEKIASMEETYTTARRQIEAAEALAEKFRVQWESGRMHMADLEAANARHAQRNRELVGSYWPLMARLKEAEAAAAAADARAVEMEGARDEAHVQAQALRKEVEARDGLLKELEQLRRELAVVGAPDEGCLAALHPDAASARAYVRANQRRIKDLSQQLVRLVDVHAGCSKRIQQHELVDNALRSKISAQEAQLKTMREAAQAAAAAPLLVPRRSSTSGGAAGPSAEEFHALQSKLAAATERVERETTERLEAERRAVRAEAAAGVAERRYRGWLAALAVQAAALTAGCEATLARDPERPEGAAAQRAALELEVAAAAAAAAPDSTVLLSPPLPGYEPTADPAAASEAAGEPAPPLLPPMAVGRLAQGAGSLADTDPAAVEADWRWEQLCDCMERMQDWGGCLLDKRMQVAHLTDLSSRLAASTSALAEARGELLPLRQQLQEALGRAAAGEARCERDAEAVARCKATATEAEAVRVALESGLQNAQQEVALLTGRLACLEEEYWGVKSKLLELELSRGEVLAAKERAVGTAQRGEEAMRKLEREAAEHRLMRQKLELDLIGCKAWIRGLEETEQGHRAAVAEAGAARDQARAHAAAVAELEAKVARLQSQIKSSAPGPAQGEGAAATRDAWAAEARAREAATCARAETEAAERRARDAEQRLMELRSSLAAMQRQVEDAEGRVRHAQADKACVDSTVGELRATLSEEAARAQALQQQVWDLGVVLRGVEAERRLGLERAVDSRFKAEEKAAR